MDERVWEKTAQFLKELRCEDTGRLSQLQLPEYQKAMKEKFSYQPIYEQTVCEMTDEQKCVIEKYVGLTEQCAEEENQQAYLYSTRDDTAAEITRLLSKCSKRECQIILENILTLLKNRDECT
jgi:predicted nucleic-acid-binding protein